jgi:hypothetical protein
VSRNSGSSYRSGKRAKAGEAVVAAHLLLEVPQRGSVLQHEQDAHDGVGVAGENRRAVAHGLLGGRAAEEHGVNVPHVAASGQVVAQGGGERRGQGFVRRTPDHVAGGRVQDAQRLAVADRDAAGRVGGDDAGDEVVQQHLVVVLGVLEARVEQGVLDGGAELVAQQQQGVGLAVPEHLSAPALAEQEEALQFALGTQGDGRLGARLRQGRLGGGGGGGAPQRLPHQRRVGVGQRARQRRVRGEGFRAGDLALPVGSTKRSSARR